MLYDHRDGLDPPSPATAALHNGLHDDDWVSIQRATFTNWVRDQLAARSDAAAALDDLQADFGDGWRLCALMEALQHRRIGRVTRRPLNQHQAIDNINLALRAMNDDGITLINIGAEDIYAGNLKLILGVVWRLILRYQIARGRTPAKKLMLAWINAVLPDANITNFSTDWNDGIALQRLVDYCKPGLCPNWKTLRYADRVSNCQQAMQLAKKHFGIPMVLQPESLSSRDLDELSGMTYLSYFMKIDSPGYDATMRWVRSQLPRRNVRNFQTDWNDGELLVSLVTSLNGSVATSDNMERTEIIQKALYAARHLGVEPVITAKEIADPDVDHLGIMAYVARFQWIAKSRIPSVPPPHNPPPPRPASPGKSHADYAAKVPSARPPAVVRRPASDRLRLVPPATQFRADSRSSFTLEVRDGEVVDRGTVRVVVTGPSSRPPVTMHWKGGKSQVEFVPIEPGLHKITVYNEDQVVSGCPITFPVAAVVPDDVAVVAPPKIIHRSPVVVGGRLTIEVNGHSVPRGSVRAEARAPSGRIQDVDVVEKEDGTYSANFTPTESGDWQVSIMHGRQHVQGSPFSVRVFEPQAPSVRVLGLETQRVSGKLANFSIETQGSGSGKLTVDVIYEGRSIPAKIDPEGQGRYHVSFTPIGSGVYTIHVYFAGIEVSGSPYSMEIIDSSEVEASGEGLTTAEVNRRATFYVDLGRTGSSRDLKVHIQSPRGMNVPASVYEGHGNITVEFVPTEVGEHYIDVMYFNKPIASSPFRCQVFDWSRIIVSNLPTSSMVEQVVEFEIDASQAGSGSLEIVVNDGIVPCKVQSLGNRQYRASFSPLDPISHIVRVTFNGFAVPGSPWRVDIRNPANVTIAGNGLHQMSVGKVAMFEVLTSEPDVDIVVNVTPPSRRTTRANVINMRNGKYQVEYMPVEVGSHLIEVVCDGILAGGSPYASRAYNIAAIAISPVNIGVVGMPVEFSIDVSQAGEGQLEISVNRGMVPNSVRSLGKGLFTVSFIPRDARPHNVDILFNGELVPQGTITIPIMPGSGGSATMMHQQDTMQVNQGGFNIRPPTMILETELFVRVTSPTGELVPAKMVLQPDGDYKVEYSSRFTGRHTVEILHNGQPFMGSPFFVEIYDPNKITVNGTKTGHVNERMEFDIIRSQAGKAELKLTITGPRGNTIPFQINATAAGDNVVYTPREPGQYLIYITYGGLDVPGCPIRQDIFDDAFSTAYGDGLAKAFVNQQAVFHVDCRGQQGDLNVQVDGPNSIAKCLVEPDTAGRYRVYYTPVEVGIYTVTVKYNGREIEGSPFHPKVTDPRKVRITSSWESLVDANNRLRLTLNELKTIEFDTRDAGPGHLIAELRNSKGPVPVEVIQRDRDLYAVSFVPDEFDEYVLKVLWNGSLVSRFPLIGIVTRSTVAAAASSADQKSTSVSEAITKSQTIQQVSNAVHMGAGKQNSIIDSQIIFDDDKVVLTGSGLQTARVNEHAEFIIDGTNAGPGFPTVQLKNTMGEVNIDCSPIGITKYRCIYLPRTPGAYLLYITWAERQVVGSPFKVTVLPAGGSASGSLDEVDTVQVKKSNTTLHTTRTTNTSNTSNTTNTISGSAASRVICHGSGLKSCIKGQEAWATIDTSRAGLGVLQAQCVGPNRAAHCKLIQREPDLYTLLIRPAETGRHVLNITFNEEHVTGSPFIVKVSGPPDPSKVTIGGPGVNNGIFSNYSGQFIVNTQGAGAGELTVKVRGPKGAFLVEMERQSQKDRTIVCRYNPLEPGIYTIEVKWSGEHVPRSPVTVLIAANNTELRQYEAQYLQAM